MTDADLVRLRADAEADLRIDLRQQVPPSEVIWMVDEIMALRTLVERIRSLNPHEHVCALSADFNITGDGCSCEMQQVWEELRKLRAAPSALPPQS